MAIATPAGATDLGDRLRELFSRPAPLTVGVEEELLLVDPDSGTPVDRGTELAARWPQAVGEAIASQLEILAGPAPSVAPLGETLLAGRRAISAAGGARTALIGTGLPPLGPWLAEVSAGERYELLVQRFGDVLRLQAVSGLHVHVCVRGPERAVGVHDALRAYLPDLAALAANAPFHGGRDTGLASARPLIAALLPRQGVPPALGSLDALAAELAWGRAAGAVPDPGRWWWELRLHPVHGTVEVRVCDAQPTVARTVALTGVIHALVAHLAEQADAGALGEPAPTWRIAENRSAALHLGLDAELADLRTGEVRSARARWDALLEELRPAAARVGADEALDAAADMLSQGTGAELQRAAGGPAAAVDWLVEAARAEL